MWDNLKTNRFKFDSHFVDDETSMKYIDEMNQLMRENKKTNYHDISYEILPFVFGYIVKKYKNMKENVPDYIIEFIDLYLKLVIDTNYHPKFFVAFKEVFTTDESDVNNNDFIKNIGVIDIDELNNNNETPTPLFRMNNQHILLEHIFSIFSSNNVISSLIGLSENCHISVEHISVLIHILKSPFIIEENTKKLFICVFKLIYFFVERIPDDELIDFLLLILNDFPILLNDLLMVFKEVYTRCSVKSQENIIQSVLSFKILESPKYIHDFFNYLIEEELIENIVLKIKVICYLDKMDESCSKFLENAKSILTSKNITNDYSFEFSLLKNIDCKQSAILAKFLLENKLLNKKTFPILAKFINSDTIDNIISLLKVGYNNLKKISALPKNICLIFTLMVNESVEVQLIDKIISFLLSTDCLQELELIALRLNLFCATTRYDFTDSLKKIYNSFRGECRFSLLKLFLHDIIRIINTNEQYIDKMYYNTLDYLLEITLVGEGDTNELKSYIDTINLKDSSCQGLELIDLFLSYINDIEFRLHTILRLATETVNPMFCNWYAESLFWYFSGQEKEVDKYSKILVNNISQSQLKKNVVAMIYESYLFDADFNTLDNYIGYKLSFKIPNFKKGIEFSLNFHPMHTTGYIYCYVSDLTDIHLGEFQLSIKIKDEFVPLIYGTPMERYLNDLHTFKYELEFSRIKYDLEDQLHEVDFINYFKDRYSKVLYDNITGFDTEDIKLFKCLLFSDCSKFVPSNPIQALLSRNKYNISDFLNCSEIIPYTLYLDLNLKDIDLDIQLKLIEVLLRGNLEPFEFHILIKKLHSMKDLLDLPSDLILDGLIRCINKEVRLLISSKLNYNIQTLISLLPETIKQSNRANTEQFFDIIIEHKDECTSMSHIFYDFFKDLTPYEMNTSNNIDMTYIKLLELIPKNMDSYKLVFSKMYELPESLETKQFVDTKLARKASVTFLSSLECLPLFNNILTRVPENLQFNGKFSDNFSRIGFCGIYNHGTTCYIACVLQCLNTIHNFSSKIISLDDSIQSTFIHELKKVFLKLKYGVKDCISIRKLLNTIPGYNPAVQEDATEFLQKLIDIIAKESHDQSIVDLMKIDTTIKFKDISTGALLNTKTEISYSQSLPTTYGYNRVLETLEECFEVHFKPEVLEYRPEGFSKPIKAQLSSSITTWPECLVIQLQRYDIQEEDRYKLYHEISYPFSFETRRISNSDDSLENHTYSLKSIIFHEGEVESGHYISVVRTNDNKWLKINDDLLEFTDAINIKSSFNHNNRSNVKENVSTPYILFYQREDIDNVNERISCYLERKILAYNYKNWPQRVTQSYEFVDFAKYMFKNHPHNKEVSDFLYMIIFRICFSNFSVFQGVVDFITQFIDGENFNYYFNFVSNNVNLFINSTFYSEATSNCILDLTYSCLLAAPDSFIDSLELLINVVKGCSEKRAALFMLKLIGKIDMDAVNWVREHKFVYLLVSYLLSDIFQEYYSRVTQYYKKAFEFISIALTSIFLYNGLTEVFDFFFSESSLSKIHLYLKFQPSLVNILEYYVLKGPDQFRNSSVMKNILKNVLQYSSNSVFNSIHLNKVSFSMIWKMLQSNILSNVEDKWIITIRYLETHLPNPKANKEYFTYGFIEGRKQPKLLNSHPLCLIFSSILPEIIKTYSTNRKFILDFAQCLENFCYVSPQSVRNNIGQIMDLFPLIMDHGKTMLIFIRILLAILAYDKTSIEQIQPEILAMILSVDINDRNLYIPLIHVLGDKVQNTAFLEKIIEENLINQCDEYSYTLSNLVKSYKIKEIKLSSEQQYCDFSHLFIINDLFDNVEESSSLGTLVFNTIIHLAKTSLCYKSSIFLTTVSKFKQNFPTLYTKLIDELKESNALKHISNA